MLWRFVFFILVLFNAFLVYSLIWGPKGVQTYRQMKGYHQELIQEVSQTKKDNVELSEKIRLLKNNDLYLEKTIRSEMRFVQPEEVLYLFSQNNASIIFKPSDDYNTAKKDIPSSQKY